MEKKLNLSAPLISARRYSSPLRTSVDDSTRDSPPRKPGPSEQPDSSLGEVVKPGTIPFIWEQIPGKAKSSNGSSQVQSPDEIPSTPKLPPAFHTRKSGELNGFRTPSSKLSGELVVLKPRNKLSGELNVLRPQSKFSGEIYNARNQQPKFSGELNTLRTHNKLSGELGTLSKYTSFNDTEEMIMMMNGSCSESDNEDGKTFSDAHETFSQMESSSVNCSISGLSGSERPETKLAIQASGVEPRARDFMMNRFLPAAKAMTLEPSQYSSRKQLVPIEKPKEEVKALVPTRAKTPPLSRNVCHIVPYTGQDIGSEESEEDEDDGEEGCDEQSAMSVKIKHCGFLPWFCSKNSIRLVNPLPSMKSRSKSALSSATKVSSFVKNKSWKSSGPKIPKNVPCSNNIKQRVEPAFKSCELQKPKLRNRPIFYSGELQTTTTRTGSPYRNRNSPSAYRNESPHTLYQKGVGVLAMPKRVNPNEENRLKSELKDSKRFQQLRRTTTATSILEETMYIDSVNIAKVSHSILNLPKTKRQVDASGNDQLEGLSRSGRLDIMRARGLSGPLVQKTIYSEASKMADRNTCRELVAVGDERNGGVQSPLNPPLPKSPSESWLSRKLPSSSPRNSVSYSSLNSKIQSRKQNLNAPPPPSGAKWETIVKSSHLHHDLGRFSEELITHVPQRQQTRK